MNMKLDVENVILWAKLKKYRQLLCLITSYHYMTLQLN